MSFTEVSVSDEVGAGVQLRRCGTNEFPEFHERMQRNLGVDVVAADREVEAAVFEPERALVGMSGGRVVATAAAASRRMTVSGAVVPVAAVMMMSVAPTHRRRGVLTRLVRRQLDEFNENGQEAIAALWAAEAGIYGRFGYGLATRRAVLTGATRDIVVRRDLLLASVQLVELSVEEALPTLARFYDGIRPRRPGWLERSEGWWRQQLVSPDHGQGGWSGVRVVLCEDEHGKTMGYALYAMRARWSVEPACEVFVREVVTRSPQVYGALWKFLVELDLVRSVRCDMAPVDEPLQHMVVDPRAVQLAVQDGVWVRLVDVQRALTERRYTTPIDAVIEVADPFCAWNAGRWRIAGGPDGGLCERTKAEPEVILGVSELGAAYLGSTSLALLAAAGRVDERRTGVVARLSRALLSDTPVFCPEHF